MFDRDDLTFRDALYRQIMVKLQGDAEQNIPGMLQTMMSCPDWDAINRLKGEIIGYQNVMAWMNEIAQKMNDGYEPTPTRYVRGMN